MCNLMPFKTVPFGHEGKVHLGSDVASLSFSGGELLVRVAREVDGSGIVQGLDIQFRDASAIRYLDEADLARYWISEGFVHGFHVLQVTEGGWSDEENESQGYASSRKEWLVVTGNACVSVFARTAPTVSEATWLRDA
ncbi:MAG: hypothetical protein DI563_08005 [Variovorax paradoxus]|uniref:Uncharacterized protein n=1 Tax=Variovorax paradoxus TaxID=34073 RepID=A0A2W5QI31_VARPD|nr:MAG: hypothetical protein DI563_08005 [Variovorax paradoxus]